MLKVLFCEVIGGVEKQVAELNLLFKFAGNGVVAEDRADDVAGHCTCGVAVAAVVDGANQAACEVVDVA